jgi:hypothetical protein
MAHTSEQRDRLATSLCGARKKNGEKCRAFAGQGTSHRGYGTCKYHGGSTPNGNKKASRVEAQAKLVKLGLGEPLPDNISPQQQLLWLARTIGGHVQTLLADPDLADLSTETGRATFRLTMEQVDRAARLAKQCSEANVEQTEANIRQAEATLMVQAIRDAARDVGLTNLQVRALGAALRLQFERVQGDGEATAKSKQNLAQLRGQIETVERRRIEREAAHFAGLELPPDELLTPAA